MASQTPRRPARRRKPSPARSAKPRSALARKPAPKPRRPAPERILPLEVDPAKVDAVWTKLKGEVVHWANKGRFTKVRFKFRGKPLLPDLPIAAVAAAQGLTFYWGGVLRALAVNLAGGTVFDVELVNDSDQRIALGKEALLVGDLEKALGHFREAVAMDRDNPRAQLNLGIALKLKGERDAARVAFEHAHRLNPDGPAGQDAQHQLNAL